MLTVQICNHLDIAFDYYWEHLRPAPLRQLRHNSRVDQQHLTTNSSTGHWLVQKIARKQGICANQKPQFLASYLWQLIEKADRSLSDQSPFEPSISVWAIEQYLQEPSPNAALASALTQSSPLSRFKLAAQIAAQFDRYLVFRLDWLSAWQKNRLLGLGPHEEWHAALWRYLLATLPGIQPRHPFDSLRQRFNDTAQALTLPKHIIVWSMDSVPALYWDTLAWLGRYTEVTMFLFDVSPAFTQDLVSRKQWLTRVLDDPIQHAYLEVGHPLLCSWGKALAEQQRSILDRDLQFNWLDVEPAALREGVTQSQLFWLQQSIASGQAPSDAQLIERAQVGSDSSIQLISAHSLRRQLEALKDKLHEWLAEKEAGAPRSVSDVLVVCVDIESATPLVPGIFNDFAFRLTQSGRLVGEWTSAFFQWCKLLDQSLDHMPIQDWLNWLTLPYVQDVTDTSANDIAQWQRWLELAGAKTIQDWPTALARLELGLVIEPVASQDVLSRQPVPIGDESELKRLSALAQLLEQLISAQQFCAKDRSLLQWRQWLTESVRWYNLEHSGSRSDGLAQAFDTAAARDQLNQALVTIGQNIERSGSTPLLSWPVLLEALSKQMERQKSNTPVSGALTFAGPNDLRHIPFKLVVWVGLDDGAFPRPRMQSALDLMTHQPRWGDQTSTVQDRSIFLESLMLAQDQFWMFYNGRDMRRNEILNPSVLVNDMRHMLTWIQPVQLPLASTQSDNVAVTKLPDWPLVISGSPIIADSNSSDKSDLNSLKRFVDNPARHFLRHALGLNLEWRPHVIDSNIDWIIDDKELGRVYFDLHRGLNQAPIDHPRLAPSHVGLAQQQLIDQQFAHLVSARQTLGESPNELIDDRVRAFASTTLSAWVEQLFHCAYDPAPKTLVVYSWKEGKVHERLQPIEAAQAHESLNWLRQHEIHSRQMPSLLFANAAIAWAKGKPDLNIEQAFTASQEETAYERFTDLSDKYAALVWRGNSPSMAQVLAFNERYLGSLRSMLKKEKKA
jgi:exonuclease V gamma subunit